MDRCCYKHYFLTYDHYKSDGTEQCWLSGDDVANFGTIDEPIYYCVFHAPVGKVPIDKADWIDAELKIKQATRLVELLEEWKKEAKTEEEHKAFSLPGIRCGQVDFSSNEFPGDLWLGKSDFSSHVNFSNCTFKGQVGFRGATFQGGVDFSGSTFLDRPVFLKATFLGPARFKNVDFKSNAEFMQGVFCEGLDFLKSNFNKNVDFSGALFKKQANLNKVIFHNNVAFQKVVVDGNLNISGLVCHGGFAIEECLFIGHVTLNNADINGAMYISQCDFNDRLSLNAAHFRSKVTFSDNTLKKKVACIGSSFDDDVNFNMQCFDGHAEFGSSRFQEKANFTNCIFRDNASFIETEFYGATFFKDATFEKSASFQKVLFSDLDMVGTNYNSGVSFKKASFNDLANLNGLTAHKNLDFSYVETKGKLLLHGVKVNRLWLFGCNFDTSVTFNGCSIGTLNYETHKGERVAFNRCKIEYPQLFRTENETIAKQNNYEIKWSFSNQDCSGLTFLNMSLEGADFLGADIVDTRFISCHWEQNERYAKVSRHNEICATGGHENLYLLYSLYQQLKKNLEDVRDYQSSGDFHYREMELRSKLLKEKRKKRVERFVLWLYWVTSDYGENYVKIAGWFVMSFVVATLLMASTEIFKEIGFMPLSADFWMQYTNDLCIRVSGDFSFIMFGLIPSGFSKAILLKKVFSLSALSRSILVFQGLTAIVFTTLFVMAIRRRFKR